LQQCLIRHKLRHGLPDPDTAAALHPPALAAQVPRLSQAELGSRLGVGQTRVARIEGNPTAVSVEQLLEVLGALGVRLVLRDIRPAQPQGSPDSAPKLAINKRRKTGSEW